MNNDVFTVTYRDRDGTVVAFAPSTKYFLSVDIAITIQEDDGSSATFTVINYRGNSLDEAVKVGHDITWELSRLITGKRIGFDLRITNVRNENEQSESHGTEGKTDAQLRHQ